MSYRNAFYNSKKQEVTILGWSETGERTSEVFHYKPHLYIEGPGNHESIFGTSLVKRIFNSQFDRSSFIKNTGVIRIFDNFPPVQQFLLEKYWEENEKPEFSKHDIKIQFIDIEVVAKEFPDAKLAKYPINVVTIYDSIEDKFYSWGCKAYAVESDDVIYNLCTNEVELLTKVIAFIKKDRPDIISGWNTSGFDIPYIMNRITALFGDEVRNSLSPAGRTYFRDLHNEMGQDLQRWFIEGIALVDYLEIYKRFSPGEKESFSLNSIAQLELGESKIDIGVSNFMEFMNNDWQKFVSYNIQDVRLLKGLDNKLGFLNLIRMFAYIGLTTFEAAMGSIAVINGAAAIRAKMRGQVMPTFVRAVDAIKNPGAFVRDPLQGFQKHIVSFDANSLYPNVMISLNMSTETKLGKILTRENGQITIRHVNGRQFTISEDKLPILIEKEKLAISKADILFTQKRIGIFPEVLDFYYKKRVKTRAELKKIKVKLKEMEDEMEEINKQLEADT